MTYTIRIKDCILYLNRWYDWKSDQLQVQTVSTYYVLQRCYVHYEWITREVRKIRFRCDYSTAPMIEGVLTFIFSHHLLEWLKNDKNSFTYWKGSPLIWAEYIGLACNDEDLLFTKRPCNQEDLLYSYSKEGLCEGKDWIIYITKAESIV